MKLPIWSGGWTECSINNLQLENLCILVAIKTEIKESCSFLDDWEGGKPPTPNKRIINVHKYKIS